MTFYRQWYWTPHGWRYIDRAAVGQIGLGLDWLETAKQALIPGYLPYKELNGGTIADLKDLIDQGNYVSKQVNDAATRCPFTSSSLTAAQASFAAALPPASSAYLTSEPNARPTQSAPADVFSALSQAVTGLVSVSQAMNKAGCAVDLSGAPKGSSTLAMLQQYTGIGPGSSALCPDGSSPPGGDLNQCKPDETDWKKIAIYGGIGLGLLVVGAVVVKAVSH